MLAELVALVTLNRQKGARVATEMIVSCMWRRWMDLGQVHARLKLHGPGVPRESLCISQSNPVEFCRLLAFSLSAVIFGDRNAYKYSFVLIWGSLQ